MTVLDQSDKRISINVMAVVIINVTTALLATATTFATAASSYPSAYEVYREYIVFPFSVTMLICLSV